MPWPRERFQHVVMLTKLCSKGVTISSARAISLAVMKRKSGEPRSERACQCCLSSKYRKDDTDDAAFAKSGAKGTKVSAERYR
jgi:hypothetical protein